MWRVVDRFGVVHWTWSKRLFFDDRVTQGPLHTSAKERKQVERNMDGQLSSPKLSFRAEMSFVGNI